MLLTQDYSSGRRAAVFFLSPSFTYTSAILSIFENPIPAGNLLAALWPRFITIQHSFYIAAVISYTMCPWHILGSASSLLVGFLHTSSLLHRTLLNIQQKEK
jgi:NCS1 family nucleobase:cation symporter-1